MKARRDAARLQEQTILAAVKRYIDAWHAIRARENKRDHDLEDLRGRITEVEAEATADINRHRLTQAGVAATLREQGQNDEQIAELLEITPKEARRLLGLARTMSESASAQSDRAPKLQNRGRQQQTPNPAAHASEAAHDVGTELNAANREESLAEK